MQYRIAPTDIPLQPATFVRISCRAFQALIETIARSRVQSYGLQIFRGFRSAEADLVESRIVRPHDRRGPLGIAQTGSLVDEIEIDAAVETIADAVCRIRNG